MQRVAMSPEEVAEIRTGLGMTRLQFAEHVGTTDVTVWRWETKRARVTPPMAKLLRALAEPKPVPAVA